MSERLLVVTTAFVLALACAAASAAVGALATRSRSRIAEAFLVGLPLFGTLCFLLALFTTSRWALGALVLVLVGVAAFLLRPSFRPVELAAMPVVLLLVALGLAKMVALLPAVSLDELAYHLTVPKTWVLEGSAVELPLLSHSYFPLGIESANLPLLALMGDRGAIAAHLLHLLVVIATAAAIFGFVRERVSTLAAWTAVAAVAATPALLATAGFAWNDWPLVGIAVVFFRSLDEEDSAGAGAALAAGLLTKYTFIPLAAVLLLARRGIQRWPLVAGLAAGSVFFVRNIILTGNPVAPFFAAHSPTVTGFRSYNLLSYVFDPRFVDEALGLALPLAICGLLVARPGFARVAGLAATFAGVLLLLLAPSSRIVVPYLVVGALAGSAVLERRMLRYLVLVAAALQIAVTAVYVASLDPLPLLLGRIDDAQYLRAHRRSFADIEQVNRALGRGSRPLVVGLNELFWFANPSRGGGNFDGPRVNAYLEAPDLPAQLTRDGITYVVFFAPATISADPRKTEERATNLSPRALENLRRLPGRRSVLTPRVALIDLRR